MDISKIDKNFDIGKNIPVDDVVWYNAVEVPFTLYGGFHDEEGYYRIPRDIAVAVSDNVKILNNHTAGIRVRFKTDSPYLAISVKWKAFCPMNHMPASGTSSFDLYKVKDRLYKYVVPFIVSEHDNSGYSSFRYLNAIEREEYNEGEMADYILNFPLYNPVTELYIGVKEGSKIEKGDTYRNSLPVVFYGSSITQGGCASRPGNAYQNFISRALDMDYVNLGFSGSGKAEDEMIEYIKGLKMSAFVSDYDHNAPTEEYLQNTHYKLYKGIREVYPNLPYVIISKPDYNNLRDRKRKAIIFETFKRALEAGDKNVYFIDGAMLFAGDERDACTVDGCHPNDLGFYRIAQGILPTLKHILTK